MTRVKKYWIGGGVLVLLLALVGVGVASRRNSAVARVEAEVLRTRDLISVVTASGELQPRVSVDVHANVNGRIVQLAVNEGQLVEEGDFLLQIDPVSIEAHTSAQEAQVLSNQREADALRVQLAQAQRDLRRARELRARDLVSEEELQRAETAVARARAELAAAEARVAQASATLRGSRHDLAQVTVSAPMTGIISRLEVEQGEFAFSTGLSPTLLLTIADLATMEAEIKVDETDVVNVQTGQPAKITIDAFPDTTFTGTVTEVGTSPILTEGSSGQPSAEDVKDFKVVVTLKETVPAPRAGLSATADIETARRAGVVALPIQALVVREMPRLKLAEAPPDTVEPGEETEGVFVIREGKARFVPVLVGITGDRFFEVKQGVAADDSVVAGSYEALRDLEDGDPVRVVPPVKERRGRRPADGEKDKA